VLYVGHIKGNSHSLCTQNSGCKLYQPMCTGAHDSKMRVTELGLGVLVKTVTVADVIP
jgi:hypothetical protein